MLSKRGKFVREIVREVVGFAPYERRTMELLKVNRDKRALKFLKRRVCKNFISINLSFFFSILMLIISMILLFITFEAYLKIILNLIILFIML